MTKINLFVPIYKEPELLLFILNLYSLLHQVNLSLFTCSSQSLFSSLLPHKHEPSQSSSHERWALSPCFLPIRRFRAALLPRSIGFQAPNCKTPSPKRPFRQTLAQSISCMASQRSKTEGGVPEIKGRTGEDLRWR